MLTIDEMNSQIQGKVKIPASIKKYRIWNNILYITMQINIEQFNTWIELNYPIGIFKVRELWYKFQEYAKNIIEYGYHFSNIKNINHFLKRKKCDISLADEIVKSIAKENNYIICNAAEIDNFKITDDKNNIEFDICVEAYHHINDPDEYIKTHSLPLDNLEELDQYLQNLDKKEILNKENNIEENDDNDEELSNEEQEKNLLDQYNHTGILHGRIATKALYEDLHNADDIVYCKQLNIQPRIISHIIKENNILALKFVITKRSFSREYTIYKSQDNIDQAWNTYSHDILNHSENYTNIGKNNINEYLTQNNFIFNSLINNIYDITINENNIIFWSDIKIN